MNANQSCWKSKPITAEHHALKHHAWPIYHCCISYSEQYCDLKTVTFPPFVYIDSSFSESEDAIDFESAVKQGGGGGGMVSIE